MDVKNTHSVTKTEISVFGRQALDAERRRSPSLAEKVLILTAALSRVYKYYECKSTAYTQTILRTWGAFSRPPMPIYAVGIAQVPSINTPTIRRPGDVDCHWLIVRDLCVYAGFYAEYKINPSPWNGTQTAIAYVSAHIRADIYAGV